MEWLQKNRNPLELFCEDVDKISTKQEELSDYHYHDQCQKNIYGDNCEMTPTVKISNPVLNSDIKEVEENFGLLNIFKSPPDFSKSNSIIKSNINKKLLTRSSTLIIDDDDECKNSNCEKSLNSSDDPDPSTSTPERKDRPERHKYKMFQPPKLIISDSIDEDTDIIDAIECSPVRSPFPSSDFLNDSTLGLDDTLLATSFDSSPKDSAFNPRENKLMNLLGRFGLNHFALIFIEQEVDVDLFLTLTNDDLKEIGIDRKTDRNIILSVIEECNKRYC
ncbi:uncharacterized protein LOC130668721 isoform X2 [Microplitis mediator]|nr:uncharacterized protein LOC130668721 isoform X2 [Microplitis mediator]